MQNRMLRAAVAAAAMLLIAVPNARLKPAPVHAAGATATVPSGLPSHLGIGLAAQPDANGIYGWMPNSGIPWDYAYQYLAGGTNTGSGWETWNSSGQFALYYAQGAASHHYIPFFSYYELLQSNGTCGGCGESQKDLANLNTPSLMSSYFQNFALLMQRLGSGTYGGITGFGKTAIVQVEPDLSGYAEGAVLNSADCFGYCTGQGNNPAYLKASVAASGYSAAAAYANTYQGFNQALLHLRDLYAPNVLLAFHISDWATRTDVGSSAGATIDAAALGQEAGSFAAQSGITGVPSGTSSYDLLTNDVLDRDAAYYKNVYGDASRWWDRLNVSFPNFHRWESYIAAAHQAAGRSVIVWQIPEGNQYFDTENNSNGHYQDNRAEYFFGHVSELAQAGIIGLLFGAGNGGSTVQSDGRVDGVTNPASFCTGDGLSSGQICNNHTSSVSDDDGGYLRMQGQQYFAGGGYPLGGTTPTNTPTAAATMTATSTPTKAATSTPTKAPASTATRVPPTATPAALTVRVSSASAAPSSVKVGSTVSLAVTIGTTAALANAVVDLEVYNSAGAKVYQSFQTAINFAANSPRTFTAAWKVPASQAAGTYTFKIGIFGPNWAPMYLWDNAAATFAVHA